MATQTLAWAIYIISRAHPEDARILLDEVWIWYYHAETHHDPCSEEVYYD